MGVSDGTIVVGSPGESGSSTAVGGHQYDTLSQGSGAAYVFSRAATDWEQNEYLKASNTEALDYFGTSVGIEGNVIVVGAPGEDGGEPGVNSDPKSNTKQDSGAAYVYLGNSGVWTLKSYLKAPNPGDFDNFGTTTAIVGNSIAVGAPYEDCLCAVPELTRTHFDDGATDSGAVYVFP